MTKELFKEFAGFLLVWVFAITMIEYEGIWWMDMGCDVIGGLALAFYAKTT